MSKCKWILIDNIDILPYVQEIARNAEAFSLQCKITTDDQLNELFSGWPKIHYNKTNNFSSDLFKSNTVLSFIIFMRKF